MIDVNFLMSDRNSFKNSIFYSFKEGVFRFDIFQKIRFIFESKNYILKEVDYLNFKGSIFFHSIFEDILYILDLNKLIKLDLNWRGNFINFIEDLVGERIGNRFLIFYREGKEDTNFDKLREFCYFISEIELIKSSIERILQYLNYKDPNLYDLKSISNSDFLINSLYSYSNKLDLRGFILFCEEVFLTCFEDNTFNLINFNKIIEQKEKNSLKYYELYTYLYNILMNSSNNSKYKLYRYLLDMFEEVGNNSRVIISQLMKIMKDFYNININLKMSEEYIQTLSESKKKFLNKYNNIPIDRLLKISIALSKYEFFLNSGDFSFELKIFLDTL